MKTYHTPGIQIVNLSADVLALSGPESFGDFDYDSSILKGDRL